MIAAVAPVAVAATTPSPLWFATRAAGVVTLVLLTIIVVLGIATALRWETARAPRFVTATLHRNLSLFALVLLAVHIITSVLDPFAGIKGADALIPFAGAYRTVWLGLGVLASEVMAALALSSIARRFISARVWRMIHWGAYASWPLAVVHGLGTGTDAQAPWLIGVTAACVAAVLITLMERLLRGSVRTVPLRLAAAAVTALVVVLTCSWVVHGPLQPGWAVVSGTPKSILTGATPAPVRHGAAAFSDPLAGVMVQTAAGTEISLRDTVDTTISVAVVPPDATQSLPTLFIRRNATTVCSATARPTDVLYALCSSTRVMVSLSGTAQHVSGRLTTSGPL